MRHLLIIALLLLPGTVSALQITSVSPSTASPGETVILTGGPFVAGALIRLGETPVRPDRLEKGRLTFTVPSLPPGDYLLQVIERGGQPRQIFNLRVTAPPPVITAVTPGTVDSCRIQQGTRVAVTGRFPAGTRMLLDGAVVASGSGAEVSFQLPPLKSGLHQIEAVGPDGRKSLSYPLVVDSVPRIFGVQEGADYVTSYEVVISGENFLFESALVVNDVPVNTPLGGQEREDIPPELLPRKDSVRYVDCNTLIYLRHPYSREPKPVTFQVINPGGEQSQVYQVSIP